MNKMILTTGLLTLTTALASAGESYRCTSPGHGTETVDEITVVKQQLGPQATLEFHFAGKSIAASPTASADRSARTHTLQAVNENGTAQFVPAANEQEFKIGFDPAPNAAPFVVALFASQGIIQDKNSGSVQVLYRYADGQHTRDYVCNVIPAQP